MKKKFLYAFLLILFLVFIGGMVFLLEKYQETEVAFVSQCKKEIKTVLTDEEKNNIVKVIKSDINADGVEDYILLEGNKIQVHTENNNNDATLDLYNTVSVIFVSGSTHEKIKYETSTSFQKQLTMKLYTCKQGTYIAVEDNEGITMFLLELKGSAWVNYIAETFPDGLKGYTIKADFDKEDENKFKIKLDNFGRDYLPENTEEYVLDFTDTGITKEAYRQTYLANHFNDFEVRITEEDMLEVVCIQNVLYLNVDVATLPKTAGKVETIFELKENKLTYKKLVVEI